MTKKQGFDLLQLQLDGLTEQMDLYEISNGNQNRHKFHIHQISNSTYILEFHYDEVSSITKHQFLTFENPLIANAYILAIYNLYIVNKSKPYYENTLREILRTLLHSNSKV
jgi:hypothetical protein